MNNIEWFPTSKTCPVPVPEHVKQYWQEKADMIERLGLLH